MFPWQHIHESVLMQNQAIQLSNDVAVTFLSIFTKFQNQSSQNFNFKFTKSIFTKFRTILRNDNCHGNTFFEGYLCQIGYSEPVMT